jgi:putative transposase
MKTNSRDGSESHPYRDVIGRRALPHDPPTWLDPAQEVFFITICCKQRRTNQLCDPKVAPILFEAVRFYEREQKWFVNVMVLMPDHVHFLVNFGLNVAMTDLVGNWKRFTSRRARIQWQRDFFDHRLRGDEGWREKSDYILQNPVRAGLIGKYEDWPYVLLPPER